MGSSGADETGASGAGLRERLQAALGPSYAVERELGGGGMSRVFVAVDERLGRRVVVKVLHPDLAAGVSAQRFEREIRLAARLQHPHVVPVHATGEVDGLPYYTMPFVEGESLRARLARAGALPIAEAVRLLRELAAALWHAHRQGVVHRDLKPENVLLSDGHAMVADFGVAKALSSSIVDAGRADASAATALGMAVGTPAYMAPEQAVGDAALDHRADLYALGVVAYELLTGAHPFAARTPQALVTAHLTEMPAPLGGRRPEAPVALAALVARLLEKRPDDRPASADEVLRVLDAVASAGGGGERTADAIDAPARATHASADAPAAAPVPARPARRRWLAAALLLLVGAAAGGTAIAYRERGAATGRATRDGALDPSRVVVASFANGTGDPSLDPLGDMAADWLARGLAGTGVVDVAGTTSQLAAAAAAEAAQAGTRVPAPSTEALARTAGAGTVVSGSYYRNGDSLLFQADLVEVGSGRLLASMQSVAAPASRPLEGVERLPSRVLGGLAAVLDSTLAFAPLMRPPPSYEAYRELLRGEELAFAGDTSAASHFLRAAALDSSYLYPLLAAANTLAGSGRREMADSIRRVLEARRDRLTPFEAALLDLHTAGLRDDAQASYAAAREMVRLAPKSQQAASILAGTALGAGRPREAAAILERLAPQADVVRGRMFYHLSYAAALHALGEHERELRLVRRGRQDYPARTLLASAELTALAALGREDELEARVRDALALRTEFGARPAQVMRMVVAELRAHGHPEAAQAVAERVLAWVEAQPAAERSEGIAQFDLPAALAAARRWERLRAVADSQARANEANVYDLVGNLGYAGFAAAMQGDTAAATRIAARLAELRPRYVESEPIRWRAQIAAALGQRAEAVALLRRLLSSGSAEPYGWHGWEVYELLRDDPAFQALVRPKG